MVLQAAARPQRPGCACWGGSTKLGSPLPAVQGRGGSCQGLGTAPPGVLLRPKSLAVPQEARGSKNRGRVCKEPAAASSAEGSEQPLSSAGTGQ